uniref:Uncharacterized protein n=1 Tax=Rhizophora mucronata TaxID=61149 RepID=A0A2P2L1Z0_RHIMU
MRQESETFLFFWIIINSLNRDNEGYRNTVSRTNKDLIEGGRKKGTERSRISRVDRKDLQCTD